MVHRGQRRGCWGRTAHLGALSSSAASPSSTGEGAQGRMREEAARRRRVGDWIDAAPLHRAAAVVGASVLHLRLIWPSPPSSSMSLPWRPAVTGDCHVQSHMEVWNADCNYVCLQDVCAMSLPPPGTQHELNSHVCAIKRLGDLVALKMLVQFGASQAAMMSFHMCLQVVRYKSWQVFGSYEPLE